jgi:hypothetical protein
MDDAADDTAVCLDLCILRQTKFGLEAGFGDDDLEKGIMTWTCLTLRAALTGFT